MKKIFDLCKPRADVRKGRVKDEEFAADLSKVVTGKAVDEYADPVISIILIRLAASKPFWKPYVDGCQARAENSIP